MKKALWIGGYVLFLLYMMDSDMNKEAPIRTYMLIFLVGVIMVIQLYYKGGKKNKDDKDENKKA